MGKFLFVDNKARYFKDGEEFVTFLKDRINKYKESIKTKNK